MPDANGNPVDRHFRIEVDDQGKFSYGPPSKWEYGRGDRLYFECNLPFNIKFLRQGSASQQSLTASGDEGDDAVMLAPGVFVVFKQLPNRPPRPAGSGPIATYRYAITASPDMKNPASPKFSDDSKNGSDIC